MTLESTIDDHVRQLLAAESSNRKEFLALRTGLVMGYSADDWNQFLRSWQEQDSRFPIPELISKLSILAFVRGNIHENRDVYRTSTLLQGAFPDYGVMDEHKAAVYFRESNWNSRTSMSRAFFHNDSARENVRILAHYGQREVWKASCPELIGERVRDLGEGIFAPYPEAKNKTSSLLSILYPNYGILDDSKCEIVLQTTNRSLSGKMSRAFFERQPHEVENAKKIVHYAYRTRWEKEYIIPEMISSRLVRKLLGEGVFGSLGLKRGGNILAEVFQNFGILDDQKCLVYSEEKIQRSWKKIW